MADGFLFIYFGDDEAYFKALQGEFQQNLKAQIKFIRMYESEEKKIQHFYVEIVRKKPAVVFIDFSKQTLDYLHLARLVSRIKLEQKVVTVGLVDYLSPPQVLAESMATGVQFTFVKGPETFDVCFCISKLLLPNESNEHGFATADLNETWSVGAVSKVGYITESGLHVETNFPLSKGDQLKIVHFWQVKKTVPSGEIVVSNVGKTNLFYHYESWADLDFKFINEFNPPADLEPAKVKEAIQEREANVIYHKKQLKKWINENQFESLEKLGKVFIIDSELQFFQNQKRSDKYPYVIRCTPYVLDIPFELNRLKPLVVAFAFDTPEIQNPKNTQEFLQALMEQVKIHLKESLPYVVIFNSPQTSSYYHELFNYQQLLATKEPLTVDLLIRMAEVFEKKKVLPQRKVSKPDKVYLNKIKPNSICEIELSINVTKLSETDLIFTSDKSIPEGMNLHLMGELDFYLHVQMAKSQSGPPAYQGLIHGIGEVAKKDLRKFVNTIFFRDHDAALKAELDEFTKLNEDKLNEKMAAEEAKAAEETKKTEEAQKPKDSENKDPQPT